MQIGLAWRNHAAQKISPYGRKDMVFIFHDTSSHKKIHPIKQDGFFVPGLPVYMIELLCAVLVIHFSYLVAFISQVAVVIVSYAFVGNQID